VDNLDNRNDRLKQIRNALDLSQEVFGARIGLKGSSVSYIESGRSTVTRQNELAICREFGVNETWLRTGEGDMFVATENALLAQLSDQYGLDALDRRILEIYITLPAAHRQALKDFASKLASAASLTEVPPEELDDNEIDRALDSAVCYTSEDDAKAGRQ